jgi:hypothetical protein
MRGAYIKNARTTPGNNKLLAPPFCGNPEWRYFVLSAAI